MKKLNIIPDVIIEKNLKKIENEILSIDNIDSLVEKIENGKIIFRKEFRKDNKDKNVEKMKSDLDKKISDLAKQKASNLMKR